MLEKLHDEINYLFIIDAPYFLNDLYKLASGLKLCERFCPK